jgi:hypothetical protein
MARPEAPAAVVNIPRWIPLALILVTFAVAVVFVVTMAQEEAPGPTP